MTNVYVGLWQGTNGSACAPSLCAGDDSAAVGVFAAMASVTGAALGVVEATYSTDIGPIAGSGVSDLTQGALLQFRTGPGGVVRLLVPGFPTEGYAGDGETVDPTSAPAATVITAVLAGPVTDRAGNAVLVYVSGHRQAVYQRPYGRG